MRAQLLTALSIAMLASACDNPQPSQPQRSISVRSEQQNALHKLSEPSLKIALRRAIYDSGKACKTVTEAGYVQEYGNLSMWTASCASGKSFAVFVGPDSSVQVRDCKESEQLKLPACTITKRAKPAAT
ncbi:MAG: hypothetical protein HOP96_06870 [Sphingomonas sp.]|nr:hypothetical protein [Sphingomonas sp.]